MNTLCEFCLETAARKGCGERRLGQEGFVRTGLEPGGVREKYGDISFRLFPFPRIAVDLILWTENDEFPARADLLFDSSVQYQIQTDVIWSIAMMSTAALL
ncbi:MAG TPA: DUF3786 domain-containing protein [Thermodesulfovibrionales bacterium]|nr:DUF3786 domain-containing protein [Thermodesulfovibrionales bacterium]